MPQGYIYEWTGHLSGNLDTLGNWFNENANATATSLPGQTDEAIIDAAGSLTGSSSVYNLALTGAGTGLTLAGQLDGQFTSVAGLVTLASGTLAALANPAVQDGALIVVGDGSGASGTVLLAGGTTLQGGWAGDHGVDVIIGRDGGSGTVTTLGAGALVTAGQDGFQVGAGTDGAGNASQGSISITAGGTLSGGIAATPPGGGAATFSGSPDPVLGWIGLAIGADGGTGAVSLQGAGATAEFGDIVSVGYGGAGTLSLSAGATLAAGDGAHSLTIGDIDGTVTGGGTVSLTAARATLAGLVAVGAYGNGTLTLGAGSFVTQNAMEGQGTASQYGLLAGETAGAFGALTVSAGATLTLGAGLAAAASGDASVQIAGTVVVNAAPSAGGGALAVALEQGSGAFVTIAGGDFQDAGLQGVLVGGSGTGVLTISGGGTLSCGSTDAAAGLTLGGFAGALGIASLTGSTSLLSCAGQLIDGNLGQATLTIGGGATLTAGAGAASAGLVVASGATSAALAITGGAHLSSAGQLDIGAAGAATLQIAGGASVTATCSTGSALELANAAGASASATITDAGTRVTLTGGLTVGNYGSASLLLENNAALATSSTSVTVPGLAIAAGTASSTLTITSGATLTDSGQLILGGFGAGTLILSDGGSLTTTLPAGQNLPAAVIAASAGTLASSATVTEAQWQIGGALLIGHAGAGALTIGAGGSVTAGAAALSDATGGAGTLTIGGAGAQFGATALTIGAGGGAGTIALSAGGSLAVSGTLATAGTLACSVTGATATLGALSIGQGSNASLSIGTGGAVRVTGQAAIGGTLNLSGGALTAGSASVTGTLALQGGTLQSAGSLTISAGGAITGAGALAATSLVDLGRLSCTGGGLRLTGPLSGTGTLAVANKGVIVIGREAATITNSFGAGGGIFQASTSQALAGTIAAWGQGDHVLLTGMDITRLSVSGQTLSLYEGTKLAGVLHIASGLTATDVSLSTLHGTQSLLSYHA